jgi:Fe-S cluster biogenesis protein NfuA
MTEESKNSLRERVAAVIEEIRPNLQADGGDVELVDIEGGVVKVRLQGACHCCPMAAMTLQTGIGRVIMSKVPEIESVENVAD